MTEKPMPPASPSAERTARISVASRSKHGEMWRRHRANGVNIISTWIDESGEGQTIVRADLMQRCTDEAASADLCVVYAEPDDGPLVGALMEAGAALAAGVPTVFVGPPEAFRFIPDHPASHGFMPTVKDAFNVASVIHPAAQPATTLPALDRLDAALAEMTPLPWTADCGAEWAAFLVGQVPEGRPGGEVIAEFKPTVRSLQKKTPNQANVRGTALAVNMASALSAAVRAMKRLEWGAHAKKKGALSDITVYVDCCPECYERRGDGHDRDCEYGAALAAVAAAGEVGE